MRCEKCGKNVPEQIDYCPTCKITEMKESSKEISAIQVQFETPFLPTEESPQEEKKPSIITVFFSAMSLLMIILMIIWAIILYMAYGRAQ